jgi:hypothetical protein
MTLPLRLGYQIDGSGGAVLVESMHPINLNSVEVLAREEDAFTGTWRLTTIAVCANSAVAPIQVFASSSTSSAGKGMSVACPEPEGTFLGPGSTLSTRMAKLPWTTCSRPSSEPQ